MVVVGELAVTVTAGPPFTGVAVKVYCIRQAAWTRVWSKALGMR